MSYTFVSGTGIAVGSGAAVGSGVDVGAGAVVGDRAFVGAGAAVAVGAFVAAGAAVAIGAFVAVGSTFATVGEGEVSAFAVGSSLSPSPDEQETAATMRRKTVNPSNTCLRDDFSLLTINAPA